MGDESTHCYTGACPECKAVLGVCVADPNDPRQMKHALSFVAEMRRDKLVIGNTTVGEVRAGRVLSRCAPTCATGQKAAARQAKRDAKEATADARQRTPRARVETPLFR